MSQVSVLVCGADSVGKSSLIAGYLGLDTPNSLNRVNTTRDGDFNVKLTEISPETSESDFQSLINDADSVLILYSGSQPSTLRKAVEIHDQIFKATTLDSYPFVMLASTFSDQTFDLESENSEISLIPAQTNQFLAPFPPFPPPAPAPAAAAPVNTDFEQISEFISANSVDIAESESISVLSAICLDDEVVAKRLPLVQHRTQIDSSNLANCGPILHKCVVLGAYPPSAALNLHLGVVPPVLAPPATALVARVGALWGGRIPVSEVASLLNVSALGIKRMVGDESAEFVSTMHFAAILRSLASSEGHRVVYLLADRVGMELGCYPKCFAEIEKKVVNEAFTHFNIPKTAKLPLVFELTETGKTLLTNWFSTLDPASRFSANPIGHPDYAFAFANTTFLRPQQLSLLSNSDLIRVIQTSSVFSLEAALCFLYDSGIAPELSVFEHAASTKDRLTLLCTWLSTAFFTCTRRRASRTPQRSVYRALVLGDWSQELVLAVRDSYFGPAPGCYETPSVPILLPAETIGRTKDVLLSMTPGPLKQPSAKLLDGVAPHYDVVLQFADQDFTFGEVISKTARIPLIKVTTKQIESSLVPPGLTSQDDVDSLESVFDFRQDLQTMAPLLIKTLVQAAKAASCPSDYKELISSSSEGEKPAEQHPAERTKTSVVKATALAAAVAAVAAAGLGALVGTVVWRRLRR